MYEKSILDNGLRIVSHRMPGMKSVSIGIWIATGSRFESERNSGISHFLEHLFFKGTGKRSAKRLKEDIEGIGGTFNGFTSEEITCFLVKVPGRHFALGVDVLSDMILNPLLKPEDIEKERMVICEEIKMYMDLPMHYVHDLLDQLFWPAHPLGRFISGTIETVSGIDRERLIKYKIRHFHPKNIVLAACGDISHTQLVKKAEKSFSASAKFKKNIFKKAVVSQVRPRTNFFFKETEQTHIALGVHALRKEHPARHALALLNIILGANMSSRLFNEVREKRGLAYDIHSSVKKYRDTGAFVVSAGVENGKLSQATGVISEELRKVKRKEVRPAEFRRAKEYYTGQLLMALEDTMSHMLWLGESMVSLNKTKTLKEVLANIEKVEIGDLKGVADRLFRTGHLSFACVGSVRDKQIKKIRQKLSLGGV